MAGREQHFIPQFFQRGFGIADPKIERIWVYKKQHAPFADKIQNTAVEFDFYSPPPVEKEETLDDRITKIENSLSQRLAKLKKHPFNTTVNAEVAARLVIHLTPRTAHLRTAFETGMEGMISLVGEALNKPDYITNLMGINSHEPSTQFVKNIEETFLEDIRFAQSGLPLSLIQKLAYNYARENIEDLRKGQTHFRMAFDNLSQDTKNMAKDSHNKGVDKFIADPGIRKDHLMKLKWSIITAPAEGALMPDCVAWCLLRNGKASPYMLSSLEELESLFMPISTTQVLVGISPESSPPNTTNINALGASCCHAFYGAHENNAALLSVAHLIGTHAAGEWEAAISEARESILPTNSSEKSMRESSSISWDQSIISQDFSYQLSFAASIEEQDKVVQTISEHINAQTSLIPLSSLRTVYIGSPLANNGWTSEMRNEFIDGSLSQEISLSYDVVKALAGTDQGLKRKAFLELDFQLVRTAFTAAFIHHFPTMTDGSVIGQYTHTLINAPFAGLRDHIASYYCAERFPNQELLQDSQQRFLLILESFSEEMDKAISQFKNTGNLDQLLISASTVIQYLFQAACHLLGLFAAHNYDWNADVEFKNGLSEKGGADWLRVLNQDLQNFRLTSCHWASLEEFSRFFVFIERWLWSRSIFIYPAEDDRIFIRTFITPHL